MNLMNTEPMAGSADDTTLVADRDAKATNTGSDDKVTSTNATVPQATDPVTSTERNGTQLVEIPVTRKAGRRMTHKETVEAVARSNQQRRPDAIRPRHKKKRKLTKPIPAGENGAGGNAAVSSSTAVTVTPIAQPTSKDQLEFHSLSNFFPMMSEEELRQLADDIAQHGQLEPITTFEGKILDGRNRYLACLRAGVTPAVVAYEGSDSAAFVVSQNLQRRNLTPSQRAVAAVKLLSHLKKEAKRRMLAGKGADGSGGRGKKRDENPAEKIPQGSEDQAGDPATTSGRTRDLAAAFLGVNPRYIDHAITIQEKSPKDIKAIRDGKKTISKVMSEIRASESDGEPEPLPKSAAREVDKLKAEKYEIVITDRFHLFDWRDHNSEKALAALLRAVAEQDSILVVTSPLVSTMPENIGPYVLLTWLVLERAEGMDCDAFNMDARHELAAVYVTEHTTLRPQAKVSSLIKSNDLFETVTTWFPDRKKLALFAEEAPKGWTLLEGRTQL